MEIDKSQVIHKYTSILLYYHNVWRIHINNEIRFKKTHSFFFLFFEKPNNKRINNVQHIVLKPTPIRNPCHLIRITATNACLRSFLTLLQTPHIPVTRLQNVCLKVRTFLLLSLLLVGI